MDVSTSDLQGYLCSWKITCLQLERRNITLLLQDGNMSLDFLLKVLKCMIQLLLSLHQHAGDVEPLTKLHHCQLTWTVWKYPSNAVGWGCMFCAVTCSCVSVSSSVCVRVVEMIDHSAGCFPYNVWRS